MVDDATSTSHERKRLAELLRGRRAAALTGSMMVRGVMPAIGWLGSPVKALPLDGLDQALAYLGLPESSWAEVHAAMAGLCRTCGVRWPASLRTS